MQRVVGAVVVATISTVYPGFLIGALSVQVSKDFGVSDARYGWFLGGFFLSAAAGSRLLGGVVQRVGPRRQMTAALLGTAIINMVIALWVSSFWALIAALAMAGLLNAACQTAVNLALARARLERLGLAIAIKQSGMPTASLLSGLAVPLVALTVGWRWAYVGGAIFALVALVVVRQEILEDPHENAGVAGSALPHEPPVVVSSRRALFLASVCAMFLAFCAGALNAWTVASGVDAGINEGVAGLLLSVGAASGIVLRLVSGSMVDTMTARPFRVAGLTVLVGAAGMALLSVRLPGTHMVATVLAFAGGWIWPVFTNFGIIRTNQAAAGTATGVTQTGVYLGVFSAPVITGWLIDTAGYTVMWSVVAASALVGSAVALLVADEF